MVGAVGSDSAGVESMDRLHHEGIDTSSVARVAGETGRAFVLVDAAGENSIVVRSGANHADGELAVRACQSMQSGDLVVMQGELPWSVTAAVANRAEEVSARLVLNLAPVGELSAEVLALADPLIVNESEALELAHRVADADLRRPGAVEDALRGLCRSLVITRGGKGAFAAEAQTSIVVRAERVQVIDTTGAGDAFVGAVAASLAKSHDLPEAVHFANRVAGRAVGASGAMDAYPRLEELD